MAKSEYYLHSDLPPWETMMPRHHSVIDQQLIKKEKLILPLLHIKLGLMKQFTKSLKQTKPCFQFFKVFFHKTNNEGIFVGPQIRQLLDTEDFEATMSELKLEFRYVFKRFWESRRGSARRYRREPDQIPSQSLM